MEDVSEIRGTTTQSDQLDGAKGDSWPEETSVIQVACHTDHLRPLNTPWGTN